MLTIGQTKTSYKRRARRSSTQMMLQAARRVEGLSKVGGGQVEIYSSSVS